jgi:hypothetical protein
VRRYFKNPCNNPSNRLVFKNLGNNHASRYYYKNPANAPILFTQPLGPSSSSAPGAVPGGSLEALLGAWVPFLRQAWLSLVVAVCGGLVLLGGTWWRQHSRAVATGGRVWEGGSEGGREGGREGPPLYMYIMQCSLWAPQQHILHHLLHVLVTYSPAAAGITKNMCQGKPVTCRT